MQRLRWLPVLIGVLAMAAGCGTTKWSDSPRTATEQLLISDAVDRAISEIDFTALADQSVFLDTRFIVTTVDQNYVTSTLRQHMLASGCIIKDKAEDADYVVEVRSGSLGTNRNDLLLGVPATNLPTVGLLPAGSAAIPEIALAKTTNQHAVCKIAVFAYDRMSGQPVWQSGNRKVASKAKDSWLLGTGPFQRGSIYDGTSFAGEKLRVPLPGMRKKTKQPETASVGKEQFFRKPGANRLDDAGKVENAGFNAPMPGADGPRPLPPAGGELSPAKPSPDSGAAKTPAPAKPKAAYTPPPAVAVTTPPPAGAGPQGNLAPQSISSPANPAASTAGMLETYNLARGLLNRD
jgi:Family of unknown function (DUF6655)